MKHYKIMWWVSAKDLGGTPWIPEQDDTEFEAERHEIDRDGNLTLFVNGQPSAFFKAGNWAMGAMIESDEAPT